jgi:site-specific DNA recombinase
MRCVRFAAVSSKPQAGEDKDSIPKQLERQAKVIKSRGWIEAHDPLVVPGHTRSIDFLHEAIEEIPAIADLIKLARNGEIDIVLCRDYDRLSRTRALLPQLSKYLARCRVQIYALQKPIEPVPPDELDRRGRGAQGAVTVETLSGLISENEVARIVDRHYDGMNAIMRRGRWKRPRVVFGYTRLAEHSTPENPIYTDVPRQVPQEVAVIRRIEELYLDKGFGVTRTARQLNAEKIPARQGGKWHNAQILRVLTHPFYCGYIVWGITRVVPILDHKTGHFKKKPVTVKVVSDLEERLGRSATLFDLLDHAEELAEHDVIVRKGHHDPIRTEELQREIYAEIDRRRKMGGRGASTSGDNPNIFTGIIFCACGTRMVTTGNKQSGRIYYGCLSHREGHGCDISTFAREDRVLDKLLDALYEITQNPRAIEKYIESQRDDTKEPLLQNKERLSQAAGDLETRRQRWDDAYEAGVISLADYTDRIAGIANQQASIGEELTKAEAKLARSQDMESRKQRLLQQIANPPDPNDKGRLKAYLRRIIKQMTIDNGELVKIEFRL